MDGVHLHERWKIWQTTLRETVAVRLPLGLTGHRAGLHFDARCFPRWPLLSPGSGKPKKLGCAFVLFCRIVLSACRGGTPRALIAMTAMPDRKRRRAVTGTFFDAPLFNRQKRRFSNAPAGFPGYRHWPAVLCPNRFIMPVLNQIHGLDIWTWRLY